METYGTRGGTRSISSRQIREMKKNMQKVPRIQKKSDEFHRREQETADRILDKVEEINNEGQSTQEDPIQTINKDTLKNIRQKIRFIFTK